MQIQSTTLPHLHGTGKQRAHPRKTSPQQHLKTPARALRHPKRYGKPENRMFFLDFPKIIVYLQMAAFLSLRHLSVEHGMRMRITVTNSRHADNKAHIGMAQPHKPLPGLRDTVAVGLPHGPQRDKRAPSLSGIRHATAPSSVLGRHRP